MARKSSPETRDKSSRKPAWRDNAVSLSSGLISTQWRTTTGAAQPTASGQMTEEAATRLRIEIGQRIRLLRYAIYGERKRQDFLRDAGIDKSTLGRIEKGEQFPDYTFAIALKRTYRVTYDWLLEGDDRDMPRHLAETLDRLSRKSHRIK